MKKLYFLLIAFCVVISSNAQIINFPDANFKAKLLSASPTNYIAKDLNGTYFKIDANNDGEIQVNEALAVSLLSVNSGNITSLSGIDYFANLSSLLCNNNQLTNVDLSSMTSIVTANFSNNQLVFLNVANLIHLDYLECKNNQLTSLNLNGLPSLRYLACSSNQITSLDVSILYNLKELYCDSNQISSLSLLNLPLLYILNCSNNLFTNLNITGLHLSQFYCANNQIQSLNIAGMNFTYLLVNNNQLSVLDLSAVTNLSALNCSNNFLTVLDVSASPYLGPLDCSNNQITTLNLNNNPEPNGGIVNCSNNHLISLFVKNGHDQFYLNFSGNPNLQYVCADNSQLTTIQNKIDQYGYTNCHLNTYCTFTPGGTFYTIQGNTRYDGNNNGCDNADINFPNLKLSFFDGINTGQLTADFTGNYHNSVQQGTHTITPVLENPTYFNILPASASVNFPTAASPYTQDFCISANGTHNDLEISLIPTTIARPGFDTFYKIIYKNKGTTIQSGAVNLSFDDAVLDYISANPSVTNQTFNNLNWSFTNLLPCESREITLILNVNSPLETPPVNSGYTLIYHATVVGATDETPTDNTFSYHQIVVDSLDPNDKTCLEGATIPPSSVGKYIHYMIRFENNGTANAQNIVVKDIIDTTKFDINSLVPINGSSAFTTRITNTNQVEFIFQNINLPFDDANNDGYIAFKIKTMPSLVIGDTFSNTASIYFDYNAPIITNTSTTTVSALATQDFVFTNYLNIYPNPAKETLHIETKTKIEITSINIYNTLGQLILTIPNAQKLSTIDVSSLKTGNYFIKVNSDKGTSNTKFFKD